MKAPLFEFPSFQYEAQDWEFKKKSLLKRIADQTFIKNEVQGTGYYSDRSTNNKSYVRYLEELFAEELNAFCNEARVTCTMTDAWCVKYQKGDHQVVHNHRGWGFSGALYVEFDPRVHTATSFVAPWQEARTDTTFFSTPKNIREGTIFIFPSYCLHYVQPNQSRKQRTVISFDLLPQLPEHQSLNRNV